MDQPVAFTAIVKGPGFPKRKQFVLTHHALYGALMPNE
jgi:hypothetical protein